jgi:predicted nucleotidyltransferase
MLRLYNGPDFISGHAIAYTMRLWQFYRRCARSPIERLFAEPARRLNSTRACYNAAMNSRDEPLAALRGALPELRRRWPIRSLAVFGSVAREEAGPASDLDILVEFGEPIGLSAFLALEDTLTGLAGQRVDLVSRAALKPHIGRRVLQEAVPL